MTEREALGPLAPRRWLALLRQTEGETYLDVRDVVLSRPEMKSLWQRESERPGWRYGRMGDILDGWTQHRDVYAAVEAEVDAVDFAAAKKLRSGPSGAWRRLAELGRQHGALLLPRLWEQLWKRHGLDDPDVTIAYLHMLAEVPHLDSEGPLVHAVEHADDFGLQDLCMRVLMSIPQQGLQGRCERLQRRHGDIAGLFQRGARKGAT